MERKESLYVIPVLAITLCLVFATQSLADGYRAEGKGGAERSFDLEGGEYNLYVVAKYPIRGYNVPGFSTCFFSGSLDRVSPTFLQIWSSGVIQKSPDSVVGYTVDRPATLYGGRYNLYITSSTDCNWTFFLVYQSPGAAARPTPGNDKKRDDEEKKTSQQLQDMQRKIQEQHHSTLMAIINDIGGGDVDPVHTLKLTAKGYEYSQTTSLQDRVRFSARYRTGGTAPVQVSGTCQILHDGKIIKEFPLKVRIDEVTRTDMFYADVQWNPGDLIYLGKNTAKFVMKIGSVDFVRTGDFTLVP